MARHETRTATSLRPFGTSVFTAMTALAVRHGAVNLGQGFPDFDAPEAVKEAAAAAIRAGHNQYARPYGLPLLVEAIADHRRRFLGLDYDPMEEVTVMAGATEALHAAFSGLFDPGDELLLFEPVYDSYRPGLAMAGATARIVPLAAPDFRIDPAALAGAVGPRTRGIVLNTPHNPTGRVFDGDELEAVAALCRRHDLLVVADEVYEHLVYGGAHRSIATLPGMRERTVLISSAGKTFSCTGWKIGYACAPPALTAGLRAAHQFITFTNGTPFQHAIAAALRFDDTFFEGLVADYRRRRDRLVGGLRAAGFAVRDPEGTYFAIADATPFGVEDGDAFCRELPERCGVAAIPVAAFLVPGAEDEGPRRSPLLRFAFCKSDPVLEEGIRRLACCRPRCRQP